jgi:hypothetical protein
MRLHYCEPGKGSQIAELFVKCQPQPGRDVFPELRREEIHGAI